MLLSAFILELSLNGRLALGYMPPPPPCPPEAPLDRDFNAELQSDSSRVVLRDDARRRLIQLR
jgi:hypothetical protein